MDLSHHQFHVAPGGIDVGITGSVCTSERGLGGGTEHLSQLGPLPLKPQPPRAGSQPWRPVPQRRVRTVSPGRLLVPTGLSLLVEPPHPAADHLELLFCVPL